jgi:pyridoxal phosphate enzyme (YggS family)
VQERIRKAEAAAGRTPGSVQLLAVSKTQGSERIREAWEAGQRRFGESYLQEAVEKIGQLRDLDIEWHFIGRIQSNKTRTIAEHFAWVHGLCDAKHARRLSEQRPAGLPPLDVCIQVNVSGEASKGGLEPDTVTGFLEQCRGLPGLRIRGLMAIPAPADSPEEQHPPLRALRQLRDRLARPELPLETLSMGMSADLEAAVAEGATIVRIGTAIFGPRHYAKH